MGFVPPSSPLTQMEFNHLQSIKAISWDLCKDIPKRSVASCWIYNIICPVEADKKFTYISHDGRCSKYNSDECKLWRTKIEMLAKFKEAK